MEGQAGIAGGGDGQTREHAQLARALGVEQLAVVVNKMDVVGFAEAAFNAIKEALTPFLRSCGYKDSAIRYIPVSALQGENLVAAPTTSALGWYKGPTLLEIIDLFTPAAQHVEKPLRVTISELVRSRTLGQAAVGGKIEAGAVQPGSKVLLMPIGELATVKAIERGGAAVPIARAGDSVDLGLNGVDAGALAVGGVLCNPKWPVPRAVRFEARILTLALTMPLLRGAQVTMHAHCLKEPAHIAQLVAVLDPKTGATVRQRPRHLTTNQSCLIEVVPDRPVCLEAYADFRALGRLALRDTGRTLAVGIVTKILQFQ
eukprot:SM000022S07229  [mRNA]  locus=s22:623783:625701:- [translate_table: standard]